MAPAKAIATILPLFFLSLITMIEVSIAWTFTTTQSPVRRTTKAVKTPGGNMEIIEEETCSDRILRLTCRSLRAFIFVLEAEYRANETGICRYESLQLEQKNVVKMGANSSRLKDTRQLKGNYIDDEGEEEKSLFDLRPSLNKKCSGQHHCRYSVSSDHPGATYWHPATLRLKFACIPEIAVCKYCNVEVKVPDGEGGYIKSPGYPLYYPGGYSCGWTFKTVPGKRIVLTFHDLNIRSPDTDGSCVDVVRVRENDNTLFEYCGVAAGVKIISNSSLVTLELIASTRLYPARGFLLQYQVFSCPDISTPSGSDISNDSVTSRTFLCRADSVFPETKERKRILACKNGGSNDTNCR